MKMNIQRIQFILFFAFITHSLMAQDYADIVKLTYSTTSQNSFENSSASTSIHDLYLETTLPIALNNRTNFLTGFIYERIQTKLFEEGDKETFSSISLKIGMNKNHSSKWSGTYVLVPKLASDFNRITWKDFQLGGFVLMKYTKNENTSYKVGLYANSELFGPWVVVPLLGLYYINPDKKLEVNITMPIMADINYALHKNVAIGMNYFGQVRTYHLTKITLGKTDGYVHRSTNELSFYLKFILTKNLIIQTKAGRSVGRYYSVYDEDDKISFGLPLLYIGDNRQQLNTDFEDGWIYQAMLLYRLHRKP